MGRGEMWVGQIVVVMGDGFGGRWGTIVMVWEETKKRNECVALKYISTNFQTVKKSISIAHESVKKS